MPTFKAYEILKIEGSNCLMTPLNRGFCINNLNLVAGHTQFCPRLFSSYGIPYVYLHHENKTKLISPNSVVSLRYGEARGINDESMVCGIYGGKPFIYDVENNTFVQGTFSGSYQKINNAGEIAGYSNGLTIGGLTRGAFFRDTDFVFHEIPAINSNHDRGIATDINDSGYVVGFQGRKDGSGVASGFLWHHGEPIQELMSWDGQDLRPMAINGENTIVGMAVHTSGKKVGFVQHPHILGNLPFFEMANDINDNECIVGAGGGQAYYWSHDTYSVNLNTLISEETPLVSPLVEATAINNNGVIVAKTRYPERSYILIPE